MPIGIYQRSEAQKEFCRKIGKLYGGTERILKDKKCEGCGKLFRPYNSLRKFCSYGCAINNRPKKGLYKKCLICGKEFYVEQSFKNSKFCSIGCKYKSQIIPESKKTRKCKFCKKEYKVYRSQVKWRGSNFCSMLCFKEYKKNKFNRRKTKSWKSGAALKKGLWIVFSKYIRQRDNGICISCGKKDDWKNMDAGHYIPRTAGLSTYFDEINVNCQCTGCNRFRHGNLTQYALALQKKYGLDILEGLDKKRRESIKITPLQYQELIEIYKKKIKDSGFHL